MKKTDRILDDFLLDVNGEKACNKALDWAKGKSWQNIFDTCHRGDWMLWLFVRTNPEHISELFMAKAMCANTVRHLMKDKRSTDAVDAAIRFSKGEITKDELRVFASSAAAAAAAAAAYAFAADADANAAYANAADVAANAYAYAAADADKTKARAKKQLETADICRKYLPIEIWNI